MSTTLASIANADQIAQYNEQGYCVVDGLFTERELIDIENFFEEFKTTGDGFDSNKTFATLDKTKQQVRALQSHRYDKRVEKWLLNPNVCDVLAALLGAEPLAVQSMYYFKPPGARGQGMHQDNFYLCSYPTTCIAAWTAIDGADLDNGCLWVVPRSNTGGVLCPDGEKKDRWLDYGDSHISKFPREEKPIAVPVPRGSTMFFGGNTIHGSGPNRTTDRWRRTFIGHYIDEASEQVARFYHPVLNRRGEVVSDVEVYSGGGPCGDGWQGAVH